MCTPSCFKTHNFISSQFGHEGQEDQDKKLCLLQRVTLMSGSLWKLDSCRQWRRFIAVPKAEIWSDGLRKWQQEITSGTRNFRRWSQNDIKKKKRKKESQLLTRRNGENDVSRLNFLQQTKLWKQSRRKNTKYMCRLDLTVLCSEQHEKLQVHLQYGHHLPPPPPPLLLQRQGKQQR